MVISRIKTIFIFVHFSNCNFFNPVGQRALYLLGQCSAPSALFHEFLMQTSLCGTNEDLSTQTEVGMDAGRQVHRRNTQGHRCKSSENLPKVTGRVHLDCQLDRI